ncbi:cytochrome c-type biogenesis protein [Devosia sp. FKR38]|uniref:cytochrome c-type biogenesis protein n=1 Tax=Devosia sp. FKR38 TaxID=2562312 RepID=UPI0010BF824E|nr:cytochrome c-type biogenesis protein [Devosia sp. FKR38]
MTGMRALRALVLAMGLLLSSGALAVSPDEVLPDAAMEARARAISAGLRCLVCQNQSIDDSDADLARDLRLLVRERLVAGDSDEQVRQFLVDRYGEFVLLNPRLNDHTLVLWIAAPVLLGGGLLTLFLVSLRRRPAKSAPLSAEEQAALDELR